MYHNFVFNEAFPISFCIKHLLLQIVWAGYVTRKFSSTVYCMCIYCSRGHLIYFRLYLYLLILSALYFSGMKYSIVNVILLSLKFLQVFVNVYFFKKMVQNLPTIKHRDLFSFGFAEEKHNRSSCEALHSK